MDNATIGAIASDLLAARRSAAPVARPSASHAISLDDGYAIAAEMRKRRLAEGDRVVGAKLGFTNPPLWPGVGLTGPLWAPVFASTYTEETHISLPKLRAPEVEPEVVFGLKAGASSEGDVIPQIAWWALGLEIIDTGYPVGPPVVADQAADFCAHQKLIVGPRQTFTPENARDLADFSSELFRDGEMLSAGTGKAVMDNPLNAVEWFLRNLIATIPWPRNEVGALTSGRLSNPPALPPGNSKWELRATLPLKPLAVTISRA